MFLDPVISSYFVESQIDFKLTVPPSPPTRLFHILAQGQSGREGGGTKGEDTRKNESFFMSEEPKSWRIERQFSGWAEVSAEFRVDTANIFRMVNKSVPGIHEVCLK